MKYNKLYGTTFYGNEASSYAKENGYLDYATFSKAFEGVLNNTIMNITNVNGIGYWEQENGEIDNSDEIEELENRIEEINDEIELNEDSLTPDEYRELEKEIADANERIDELQNQQDYPPEVFQWFIVSDCGAEIIKNYTDDPLYYNEELDMYLWGVTHYGTSWDYVLTDIKLNCGEAAWE